MPVDILPPIREEPIPHRARPERLRLQHRNTDPGRLLTYSRSNSGSHPIRDAEVSPGSTGPGPVNLANAVAHRANARTAIPSSIAPWETGAESPGGGRVPTHRKELGVLETPTQSRSGSGQRIPTINRQPPTASTPRDPWSSSGNGNVQMPSSVFGPSSFFNDSSEDLNQLSPGFRPGSSQEDMGAFPGDDRRPSIASATTVSSNNSKSSVGRQFQKKLHGFFGEDFPGLENVKNGSEPGTGAATPQGSGPAAPRQRGRNNSTQNNHLDISRPISPNSFSRPQTPSHANEVTPWEFQDASGNNKVRINLPS